MEWLDSWHGYNVLAKLSAIRNIWVKPSTLKLTWSIFVAGWVTKMVNHRIPLVQRKVCVTPRRPFEKARLDQELKLIGEYGLRNKKEVWRVKYTLAKIRKASRELLTLDEKDPKRLFEGNINTSLVFGCMNCRLKWCLFSDTSWLKLVMPT